MSKIFITGINGFVGTHLHSLYKNDEVIGLTRPGTDRSNLPESIKLFEGDILDFDRIDQIMLDEKPDMVFHLAAFTSPSESIKSPVESLDNNIKGQLNILESLRKNELFDTKTLVVSTSEIYGNVDSKDLPIDEDTPLKPLTPYAVSKITQDFLGYQYFKSYGIKTIRVRPFNHIGAGQSPVFVVPAFAKQIAMIEKGMQERIIKVGNLNARKDFTDVRDVVLAYKLLMEKGEIGEVYNIGSGKSYSISEILNILLSLSKEKIAVEIDPQLKRANEIVDLYCDASKIERTVGWKPTISIKDTLNDALDYWRNFL